MLIINGTRINSGEVAEGAEVEELVDNYRTGRTEGELRAGHYCSDKRGLVSND